MPKKKEENTVTKKKRKELETEIMEEMNASLKEEITQDIVNDIKKSIDSEYKNGIKEEIKTELIDDIKKDIQKEQKKLNRSKSFTIFRLYIYIFVLIACIGYIIYRLYSTDNLTIINENYKRPKTTQVSENEPVDVEEIKDLNYYITNYGNILNNLKISNLELVNNAYPVEAISIPDRLALAYGILVDEDIAIEGIIHSISEDKIMNAYQKVFGSLDGYIQNNFSVRGLKYAYSSATQSYMAIGNEDTSVSYVNNIIENIFEDGNDIVFEVKTYVIKNDSVYRVDNLNDALISVEDNMDLSKIQDKLLGAEYRFTKTNNGYRLVSISKK